MTEQPQTPLSEEELEQRRERFRYTDLSHPLMQTLLRLQLDSLHTYIQDDRYGTDS